MIPLIDVMLVLLVIFIITAPLLTHAVKIDLPNASSRPISPSRRTSSSRSRRTARCTGTARSSTARRSASAWPTQRSSSRSPELHLRADRTTQYQASRGGHGRLPRRRGSSRSGSCPIRTSRSAELRRTRPWTFGTLRSLSSRAPDRARDRAGAPNNDAAQTIVHMLDYVSVDYPEFVKDGKVLDESEYEEQLEFSGQVIELLGKLPENPAKAEAVRARGNTQVAHRSQGARRGGLEARGELRWDVIEAYRLAVAPRACPRSRAGGEALCEQTAPCATAHRGMGDGPAARGMDPAPANFHDARAWRAVASTGSTAPSRLGVHGTPMGSIRSFRRAIAGPWRFTSRTLGATRDIAAQGAKRWRGGQSEPAIPEPARPGNPGGQRGESTYGADAAASLHG